MWSAFDAWQLFIKSESLTAGKSIQQEDFLKLKKILSVIEKKTQHLGV